MALIIKLKTATFISLFVTCFVLAPTLVVAESSIEALQARMKQQKQYMKPELIEKAQQLSDETRMGMMAMMAMHNRFSKQATFRQVMLEMLSDYQTMVMGILTDSVEMAVDAAGRLSNHRIPKGGMLAYIGLENINDEKMALLLGFGATLEEHTLKLIDAANNNNMAGAAIALGEIGAACAGCHSIFRELPGKSKWLKDNN